MFRKLRLPAITLLVALPAVLLLSASTSAIGCVRGHGNDFVQRAGSQLVLHGKPFRFVGTNNYYLMYQSQKMTDAVLDKAAANRLNVMRTWGWFDAATAEAGANGDHHVYFHYWDAAANAPAFNDGADGLQKLDYVVAAAKARGIRLVIPLTNNWSDFGGMDQYVKWAGGTYHSDFYTNPQVRQWFKDWISHLLNRTNTITHLKYKDDPTIMTWELANEPRCKGSALPPDPSCTTSTITKWAAEMSKYIKSIDRNHLVSSGSEGELCEPNKPGAAGDWTRDCSTGEGVDELAISKLPTIDVMSYHLYPNSWGKDAAWSVDWIKEHNLLAKMIHKPVMLGEYGWNDKATGKADRNPIYKQWLDTFFLTGGNGALYWILSDIQDDDSLYPDYDGYTVYCPSAVCTTIANWATRLHTGQWYFPPVADNDSVVTEWDTPATVVVTNNDIAYIGSGVRTNTVDLDPATAGRQTTLTVTGGTFSVADNGTLTFTQNPGFVGKVTATYTVRDLFWRLSNEATVNVTVKANPTDPIKLFSFETGTQGWAEEDWDNPLKGGTVAQSNVFATDGSNGLQVNSMNEWFFGNLASPVDLSSKSVLKVDMKTLEPGTSTKLVLKVGDGWTWCEFGNWTWVGGSSTSTYEASLVDGGSCTAPDLTKVQAVYMFFNQGTYYIDNIRAE
jgi:mannan endo-1,4-beta-mannosidase